MKFKGKTIHRISSNMLKLSTIRLSSLKLIILICIFATGSWVEINGIWVELPVLVSRSPQQWSLPSYLTVVIQLANIGPIIYLLVRKYGNCCTSVKPEVVAIYFILLVGVLASFLLAFTWTETTSINGTSYSTALIVLSFFLATVDCTSSVTFLPFMANFPKEYMTVYYIGEGMSGFIPSILALAQGVGKQSYTCDTHVVLKNITTSSSLDPNLLNNYRQVNITETVPSYIQTEPRFSAKIFFLCVSGMMVCSLTSFIFLMRSTVRKTKSVGITTEDTNNVELNSKQDQQNETQSSKSLTPLLDNKTKIITTQTFILLLILNAIINGLSNGILPALQSYACLPYGNNIYHLTLTLSALANPLCCFLYFYASIESTIVIFIGVCVYITSAGYTIGIAATSPCPIYNDSNLGGILVLLVTVFGVGLVNYLKTAISSVLYGYHSNNALLWNGISVQVGSLVGALMMFPMVNVYGMFHQAIPCQTC